MPDVLILGAGLSGLTAARVLLEAGMSVLVVDKGRSVGGRLATRRIGRATLDHGAQFFIVRSEEFQAEVDRWVEHDAAAIWTLGFDTPADGYPRYRGEGGMSQMAKFLAAGVTELGGNIVLAKRAAAIIPGPDCLTVTYEGASREPDDASAVIATSPIHQSLEVLAAGGISHSDERLDLVEYNKVIALLMTVDRKPDLGPVGARQSPLDPIFTFVADNSAKGISDEPAVTCHVEPALSEALWGLPDEEILKRLDRELMAVLGDASIGEIQVKKWRYAGPINPHPDRCVVVAESPGTVILCGDGFGGPKVEGAFLSGLAAANRILA